MSNNLLEKQTIFIKINLYKLPNITNESAAVSLLSDINTYIVNLRSDIEEVTIIENKDNSVLFKLSMIARRPLRSGAPETNEEREESIKNLISQIVMANRKDCKSITIVNTL